jgi:hypothetical protein
MRKDGSSGSLLHLASALWAATAAYLSRSASITFLRAFGVIYTLDAVMGLMLGSGYLDLGIDYYGLQSLPWSYKIPANLPHLTLGVIGIVSGFFLSRWM